VRQTDIRFKKYEVRRLSKPADGNSHRVFLVLVCAICNGDGEVACSKCKGTGSIPTKCDECKGTGKLTTEKGVLDCDICNGSGLVSIKCNECFGGGKLVCEACDGTGGKESEIDESI